MPKKLLRHSPLNTGKGSFHDLRKTKIFGILLRPYTEKVKAIKTRLKTIIKGIVHQPRNYIYKTFQLINSVLLG